MRQDHSLTRFLALCGLLLAASSSIAADTLNVAVASNFAGTLHALAQRFTAQTGHPVRISAASTGKLYAQVVNGAPFDVLLAADQERPALLESATLAVAGSRFSYATGRLVLWSRDPQLDARDCLAALREDPAVRVAIANPRTAPYGAAARESLKNLELWTLLESRIVRGENIAQTLHFAASGNARFGMVAASQLRNALLPDTGCVWSVPQDLHSSIDQQAVLLARAANKKTAIEFMSFLKSPGAQQIIVDNGYSIPQQGPQ